MAILNQLSTVVFVLMFSCNLAWSQPEAEETISGFHEFNRGQGSGDAENWIQAIRVTHPEPRSDVSGMVTVTFHARGMDQATAYCWKQDASGESEGWGRDENLTSNGISLDRRGNGSFRFNADEFPHGPMMVRIYARNSDGQKDIYELQLFNSSGVVWKHGIPDEVPAGAKGLKVAFEDDFDEPLSVSNDGRGARYHAHKPGGGDFSGWQFSDVLGDGKPFEQRGSFLKIAARKDRESPEGRSGLIASIDADYRGIWAKAPCYFECRFTAQSAIGTWPAFWTLAFGDDNQSDELDIIEAYGGRGKGNPNHPGYSIVSHFWNQKDANGNKKKAFSTRPDIMSTGSQSYWSTTFHTYGVSIGLDETIYYFDDIEVFRHPSGEISATQPHCFLVNLAIGGLSGWPIDLRRYGNGSDMWIDYVRVFAEEPLGPDYLPNLGPEPELLSGGIALNFCPSDNAAARLRSDLTAGVEAVSQRNWNNLAGPHGESSTLVDASGATVDRAKVKWAVPKNDQAWRSRTASPWGFKHGDLALQSGYIQLGGEVTVTDIPYEQYDVYVYAGAGDQSGAGKIELTNGDGEVEERFYRIGWTDGRFKISSAATESDPQREGNVVVFRQLKSRKFTIDWQGDLEGGWTGVTGVQIVRVDSE